MVLIGLSSKKEAFVLFKGLLIGILTLYGHGGCEPKCFKFSFFSFIIISTQQKLLEDMSVNNKI